MYKQLNKKYSGAVVMLTRRTETNVEFLGTGFVCSSDGYILTCSHIINPVHPIVAINVGGNNDFNPMTLSQVNFNEVELVQNDAIHDVALLKFKGNIDVQIPSNIFGDTDDIECGSSIAVIGFPFGHNGLHVRSITHGILSSKAENSDGVKILQFDCMIHQGNSGSPLIDLQTQQIIGIVTNRFNPSPGGGVMIGNHQIGAETNISYASIIEYGQELLDNE